LDATNQTNQYSAKAKTDLKPFLLPVTANNKKSNKALHLTPYRAGLVDGGCTSRASGAVTRFACHLGR
jgi:hypothetical protein